MGVRVGGGKCEHIGNISGMYRAYIGRIWDITLDNLPLAQASMWISH